MKEWERELPLRENEGTTNLSLSLGFQKALLSKSGFRVWMDLTSFSSLSFSSLSLYPSLSFQTFGLDSETILNANLQIWKSRNGFRSEFERVGKNDELKGGRTFFKEGGKREREERRESLKGEKIYVAIKLS